LVCVSNWLQHDVLKQLRNGVLVRNIPCGIPISQTVVKKPNGRLRLAYLGRLTEEYKRISELTRGLCRAVREVPGTEAVIYGDGPARPAVEQILREDGNGLPVQLDGLRRKSSDRNTLVRVSCCGAVVGARRAGNFFVGGDGLRRGPDRTARRAGRDRICGRWSDGSTR
jgi:glycosyltransferase involved in cell wall biosynthesis